MIAFEHVMYFYVAPVFVLALAVFIGWSLYRFIRNED